MPQMNPPDGKLLTRTYKVGQRYSVKATAWLGGLVETSIQAKFEWVPRFPGLPLLTQIERSDYTKATQQFAFEIARHWDIDVGEFDISEGLAQ